MQNNKKINLAIIGATGMVGLTFLKVLEERDLKNMLANLYLFASKNSANKKISFNGKEYVVEELNEDNLKQKKLDFAFFAIDEKLAEIFAPIAISCGATVIDNSSAFRLNTEIPLVVPEINFDDVKPENKLIANPNCSTIQCALPLGVLNVFYGLKSVNFCTYQAVSGSGVDGINDFLRTSAGLPHSFYPYSIYNNCLPQIGSFLENGYTSEEMKMLNETQKILKLPKLKISATCVRVPVLNCHSVCVSATLKKNVNLEDIKQKFSDANIKILDEPKNQIYPLCTLANETDFVYVGRMKQDLFDKKTLHFFCVADNVRKGAASNSIQILEKLLQDKI